MRLLLIIISCGLAYTLSSQIERPICDEVTEIPYSFSYSGFLIQDNPDDELYSSNTNSSISLVINVSADQPEGQVIYTESFQLPSSFNGFFSVELGTNNRSYFMDFIAYLNESSNKDYYFDLYRLQSDGAFPETKYLGSKRILTVPYAYVANSLKGMGLQGTPGVSGINGAWGPQGPAGAGSPQGDPGENGDPAFGAMPWRSSPPEQTNQLSWDDIRIYIDDGTNTSDGLPGIRFYLNGQWVDL